MVDLAVRPAARTWMTRMAVAVVGCLLALTWLWAARIGHPADGTVVDTDSAAWHSNGVVVTFTVGSENPLRAGDVVTAVDGVALGAGSATARVGQVATYTVVRDGVPLQVPVRFTDYRFGQLLMHHLPTMPYLVLIVLLPAFVIARRPRDPAAVTLYLASVLQIVGYASYSFGTQVIDVATGRLWPTVVAEVANCGLWACLLHFVASFPQPWPWLRRRPWLVGLAYGLPFLAYAVALLVSLPAASGLRRLWLLSAVSVPAAAFFPVLVLAAVVTSYALAPDSLARQRMRLVSYGVGVLAGAYLLLGRLPEQLTGHPLIPWQYLGVAYIPAQVLLAAALLRYRLWDIQIVIRRSLVYGVVTLALVGAYLGLATVIGAAFDTRLGLVPVLLALVVALSFTAARTTLRRAVSRVVYGDRDDPYEVLRQLGQRLESAHSAEVVLGELVATLVRTLRLTHAAIEVPGLKIPPSSNGTPGSTATTIDLIHDGERIGRLILDPGPDREPFGPSDRRLLDGLARQVSATAHGLLLGVRLRRSLEGTVTVLEEERRRLRREIHDGLGPTLASASMRLELGRGLIRTDPDAAERILADLAQVHRTVVDDVRHLIDGLRPTILDRLGLAAALRELVERVGAPVNARLECAIGTTPLPAAVEVAAYQIVAESLTNVVRHAQASTCTIRVWRDDELHIEVRDDGRGLPTDHQPGVGLTSIRERSAELGGRVEIGSTAPYGMVVRCRLPIAVDAATA